jgi:hypothetical protein
MAISLTACTGADRTPTGPPAADGATVAAPRPSVPHRDAASAAVVEAQRRALRHGRVPAFRATWTATGTARRQAQDIAANLEALRASVIAVRLRPGTTSTTGTGAWETGVDVTWRTPQTGTQAVVSHLVYTFVSAQRSVRVAAVRAAVGSRQPIWLTGRLRVGVAQHGPVVAVSGSVATSRVLVRRLLVARDDVHAFLIDWHGPLTAFLPSSTPDFEAVLGATPGQYTGVAAVTTALDGSDDPAAPVAIVLNPRVWSRLSRRGAHVVITHEAVHAATGTRTGGLPEWVAEGFADFVAVRSAGVPPLVADAAALRDIRRRGVPDRFPSDGDFAARSARLEATYELSRLVMQTIARHHGQRRLVAFYTAMVAHPARLDAALHTRLHTSRARLTRQWRRLLVGLPGAQ